MATMLPQLPAVLTLDVGGSHIDCGSVADACVVARQVRYDGDLRHASLEQILSCWADYLTDLRRAGKQEGLQFGAIGVALPGAVDDAAGTTRIVHKFDALSGQDLRAPLENTFGIPAFFLNDAYAFTLGAHRCAFPDEERLLGVTLGTGIGSELLIGEAVAEKSRVSSDCLWDMPFRDGVLEDYVSTRSLERSYYEVTAGKQLDVRAIAELARGSDAQAREVFARFAEALGEGLAGAAAKLHPTRVVLGGQISKASDLFREHAEKTFEAIAGYRVPFTRAPREYLTLLGAGRYAASRLRAKR